MNITYKDYPIIGFLKGKGKHYCYWWNEDERNLSVVDVIRKLNANRDTVKKAIRDNIWVLSDAYFKAMAASNKNFTGYGFDLCNYGIEPHEGCFIVSDINPITKKISKVAFLYILTQKSLQVWQMEDTNTLSIYAYINHEKRDAHWSISEMITRYANERDEDDIAASALMMTRLFLLFKHFAKTEQAKLYPKQSKSNAKGEKIMKNETDAVVKVLTTRWFTEVHHDGDFPVRPHFRMQPKKDQNGEWTHELIPIDGFVKHGYHRKAEKDINPKTE